MKWPLPPKRYEPVDNPKYDQIRSKPWFWRLKDRRDKIPLLKQAFDRWNEGKSQLSASTEFGIHERELRDYISFSMRMPASKIGDRVIIQKIIDEAYDRYCADNATRNYRDYINQVSYTYGVKPRQAIELWETDSTLWPSGYAS